MRYVRVLGAAGAACVAATAVAAAVMSGGDAAPNASTVANAAPKWPVDPPVATGIADPGAIRTASGWVVLSTMDWDKPGRIRTAKELKGPWAKVDRKLLTRKAAWMGSNKSVWAPSIVKATDGSYRVYFAGALPGSSNRCIGVARGTDARGPFTPYDRALACFSGAGAHAYDTVAKEGSGQSLIDPTPARVGGQLVLTYKTGYRAGSGKPWHTTTRMVRLNPAQPQRTLANPVHKNGASIKLADSVHKYIEENPVLVEHGGEYTLFNSFGWYGTCDYWTRYRQNTSLWSGWTSKSPTRVRFPRSMNTCGTGNADIVHGLPEGSWRILFNGHPDRGTAGGPDGLYVGVLGWSGGRPAVTSLLR